MNVIVRLYWQHDLDLISLALHPDFQLGVWMKRAVTAYARGEHLEIPLPGPQPFPVDVENMATHFVLNPTKDQDVIAALNGFRTGYRNSVIKVIFRYYLNSPRLDPFYNDETYHVKTRRKKRKSEHVGKATGQSRRLLSAPVQDSAVTENAPPERTTVRPSGKKEILTPVENVSPESAKQEEKPVVSVPSSDTPIPVPETEEPLRVNTEKDVSDMPSKASADFTDTDDDAEEFDLFGAISDMAANTL